MTATNATSRDDMLTASIVLRDLEAQARASGELPPRDADDADATAAQTTLRAAQSILLRSLNGSDPGHRGTTLLDIELLLAMLDKMIASSPPLPDNPTVKGLQDAKNVVLDWLDSLGAR